MSSSAAGVDKAASGAIDNKTGRCKRAEEFIGEMTPWSQTLWQRLTSQRDYTVTTSDGVKFTANKCFLAEHSVVLGCANDINLLLRASGFTPMLKSMQKPLVSRAHVDSKSLVPTAPQLGPCMQSVPLKCMQSVSLKWFYRSQCQSSMPKLYLIQALSERSIHEGRPHIFIAALKALNLMLHVDQHAHMYARVCTVQEDVEL